ncbi:MAG: hypothetical protein AAF604_09065 [Acidobacteriota bacterium]
MLDSPRRDALTLDLIDRLDRILHRHVEPWPDELQRLYGRPLRHGVAGVGVLAVGHFRTPCDERRRRFAERARAILRRMARLLEGACERGLFEGPEMRHLSGLQSALHAAFGGTAEDRSGSVSTVPTAV